MDCIDLFKRAAVALQTDPRYLALDQARKANDNDENLQNLIGEFNLARMDLNNEIGKSERDDARITELNEKVNNLYGQIMGDSSAMVFPLSPFDGSVHGLRPVTAFCKQNAVCIAQPRFVPDRVSGSRRRWSSFRCRKRKAPARSSGRRRSWQC